MTVVCECDVLTELDGLEAEEYAQSHLIARSDESQFRAPLTAILWCPLTRGHRWFMEAGHDDQPSHLYQVRGNYWCFIGSVDEPCQFKLTPPFVAAGWDNGWFRALNARLGLSLDEYEGGTIPASHLPAFVDLLDRLATSPRKIRWWIGEWSRSRSPGLRVRALARVHLWHLS